MKRSKKGPEISLSKLKPGNLKAPKALSDVYREIKGQHLLPIIVLLIVGLVAIPILIGSSSDHGKTDGVKKQAAIGGHPTKQVALDVSKWTPGLLNYKKRLRGSRRNDPFIARVPGYGSSRSASSSTTGEVEAPPPPAEIETGGSDEEPTVTPIEPAPGGGAGPGSGSESEGGSSGSEGGSESQGSGEEGSGAKSGAEAEAADETIDVHILTVHQDGGVDRSPVRRDLAQLTKLPSEAIPALTYVGPSKDGQKAMMAISSEVTAILGDSNCVVPAKPCSLLALEVGAPETVVYGPKGLTYRIELVRVGNETNAASRSDHNHPAPGHGTGSAAGTGSGTEPAPRGADALIGVGGRHAVERSFGL